MEKLIKKYYTDVIVMDLVLLFGLVIEGVVLFAPTSWGKVKTISKIFILLIGLVLVALLIKYVKALFVDPLALIKAYCIAHPVHSLERMTADLSQATKIASTLWVGEEYVFFHEVYAEVRAFPLEEITQIEEYVISIHSKICVNITITSGESYTVYLGKQKRVDLLFKMLKDRADFHIQTKY